jgi:hypothetical protein
MSSILCQTHAKSRSLLSSFISIQNIWKKGASYSNHTRVATFKCIKQNNINYQKGSLSSLSYLRDDCHKQVILISESHGDSNQCTPYRGKPDQHDKYASHASLHTPSVCFLWVVPIYGNLSWVIDRVEQGNYSWEKRASDTIHSTPTNRFERSYPISLSSQPWSSGGKAKYLSMVGY